MSGNYTAGGLGSFGANRLKMHKMILDVKICPVLPEVLPMKKLFVLTLALGLFCFSELSLRLRINPPNNVTAEDQEEKG